MSSYPHLRIAGCVAVSALALAVLPAAQTPQAQRPVPTFKAGVEIMRIEATVLDKKTRKPIRGLTAADFTVKVNGQPQTIAALTETEIPSPDPATAEWIHEAAAEVVTNRALAPDEDGRLVVIVMDDALTATHAFGGPDGYFRAVGIRTAHRIIDQLGPKDRAALIFPQFNQHAQDFTADRRLLRRAADSYNPQPLHPWLANKMSLGALKRAGEFLATIPDHRRALFYVTVGPGSGAEEDPLDWQANVMQQLDVTAREDEAALLSGLQSVMQTSRIAHVPVYSVSTRGLEAPTPAEIRSGGPSRSLFPNETLLAISRASGGRAIVNNNRPDEQIADVFIELSSYYVLAYEARFPMDGKLRRLEVSVNRRDAIIEPDGLVFKTPAPVRESARAAAARARSSNLLDAVAAPLAGGSLPMQMTVAPFLAPDRPREPRAVAAATVGLMLPEPVAPGLTEVVNLETRVFDGEGRKQVLEARRTVTLLPSGDPSLLYEVVVPMDLAPGRYNVRVGADAPGLGLSGGVYMTVVVPNFEKDALSMSGVAVGRANTRVTGGLDALDGLVPFAPTSVRTFSRSDIVGAMVRVYQSPHRVSAISVDTTITDAAGNTVVSRSVQPLAPFEHRYEVPLNTLAPGDYLLTFTAKTERGATASRDVRFTVK